MQLPMRPFPKVVDSISGCANTCTAAVNGITIEPPEKMMMSQYNDDAI